MCSTSTPSPPSRKASMRFDDVVRACMAANGLTLTSASASDPGGSRVRVAHVSRELLRLAPVQALSLAKRALAQASAATRDPLEQGLARPLAALALQRCSPSRGQQAGEHDQIVLLPEHFAELIGAAGEWAQTEHLGGVAQVLHAFAPLVQ